MQKLLFSFEGRINRAKFWLVLIGISFVELIVVGATGGSAYLYADSRVAMESLGPARLIPLVVFIPLLWIGPAVHGKRRHHRDQSGLWILHNLVPVICGRGVVRPNPLPPR